MSGVKLVASPGESYAQEILDSLSDATSFTLITGFASVAGIEVVAESIEKLLARGGQGRIILAVDRQGFNASAVFERLLAFKRGAQTNRLSLGVVLQGSGLLHAKALFSHGPRGPRLLVGSANLTRGALGTNHELGVLITNLEAAERKAFEAFTTSVAPRSLDTPDAEASLVEHGLLHRRTSPKAPTPASPPKKGASLTEAFQRLPKLLPLPVASEEHVASWIRRGYIVGRGRRNLDALVLRLPQEQLLQRGYIRATKKQSIGVASHETTSSGFGIDLVPASHGELLRREMRRVSLLLAKLTLNLPCFGLWMPESYWDKFLAQREAMQQADALSPEALVSVSNSHRSYLLSGGLEKEVDAIVQRLGEIELLVPGKAQDLIHFVLPRFRTDLQLRTPEVLAGCLEFRTARQRWTPYEQTDAPYRQLMVDLVQATFASTFRTGDWPRRFRSHAARAVAEAIETRLVAAGGVADAGLANDILAMARGWEMDFPFQSAVDDFRQLVPDDLAFPPPALETNANDESNEDTDDSDV